MDGGGRAFAGEKHAEWDGEGGLALRGIAGWVLSDMMSSKQMIPSVRARY